MQELVDTAGTTVLQPESIQNQQEKKVKLFLIGIIFILLFLLVFGIYYLVFPQKISKVTEIIPSKISLDTKLPENINNSSLYFISDKNLYLLSPLISKPIVFIDSVDEYEFSPDQKRVAYIRDNGSKDIFIKNLETNEELVINSESDYNRGIDWSPEGKYLLVDAGTGPEGTIYTYDSTTGKFNTSFGDGSIAWLDDRNIFITQRTKVEPLRPWGTGEGFSLAKIDILSGITEIIANADATNDYSVRKIDKTCLYYIKKQVKDPADWGALEEPLTTYYCLDLQNNETKGVPDFSAESTGVNLKKNLEKLFPEYNITNKSEIYEIVDNPLYKDWVIMNIYKGGGIYISEIFIFNLQNPRNTLQKIGKGVRITWF